MSLWQPKQIKKTDPDEVSQTINVLDSHMKRIEDIIQDNQARDAQQQRMEKWIFQLADAMKVRLKYD